MVFKMAKDSTPLTKLKFVDQTTRNLQARDFILYLLIPVNALVFAATLVLNFMASMPEFSFGLFKNGITNVSRMYEVNISPVSTTFAIWSVIYLAQTVAVLYGLSLMLRLTREGFAYANPPVLSRTFYVLIMTANALNMTWLFVWDNLAFELSFLTLAALAISLIAAMAVVVLRQRKYRDQLLEEGRTFDLSMINDFVVNGGAIYATWTVVAAHINLTIFATARGLLENEAASLLALAILISLALVYTGLDVFLLGRYTRALLTPYATLAWATAGIAANDFDPTRYSSILSLVMTLFCLSSLVFKIALLVFFPRFRPDGKKYQEKLIGLM